MFVFFGRRGEAQATVEANEHNIPKAINQDKEGTKIVFQIFTIYLYAQQNFLSIIFPLVGLHR